MRKAHCRIIGNRIRNLINITSVIYVLLLEEEFTKVLASHVLYQASLSRAIAVWNHSFPGLSMWGIVYLVVETLKVITKIWEKFLNTDSFSSGLLWKLSHTGFLVHQNLAKSSYNALFALKLLFYILSSNQVKILLASLWKSQKNIDGAVKFQNKASNQVYIHSHAT